jgi:gliding motility-associated-like protein
VAQSSALKTNADGIAEFTIIATSATTNVVSNQGNVPLSDIVLSDPLFEAPNPLVDIEFAGGDTNSNGLLDIDELWIYTAIYVITLEDIDAGEVINQAFVEGLDPNGIPVSDVSGTAIDNDDPTVVDLCQEMGIALEKVGFFDDNNGDGSAQVGETITYLFTVYNTGSVTLYNITIDDPLVPVQGGPIASLAPGESDFGTFTATYVITQQDINAGEVVNQATVYAEDFYGSIIEDLSDDPNDPTNNDINGNGNPDDPTVVVLPLVLGVDFEIFNGITPGNNDGLNDFFKIRGIENFPNNNVQIFNRWGVLVFERDNYNNAGNAFVGVSEGRVTVKQGEELPTGTYYYIIRFFGDQNPGRSNYSGYLYLNR